MLAVEREMTDREFETQIENDMAGFQHDPYGFVMYSYPWGSDELIGEMGPDAWQEKTLKDLGRKLNDGSIRDLEGVWRYVGEAILKAVGSGHGIGKSALIAWILDWAMSTMEDTRAVVTANTDTQLKTKTWPEVSKWFRMSINAHWFTVTATRVCSADPAHADTWRADAIPWSEIKPEAFAGLHNKNKRVVVLFDESSAIADAIWDVTEGTLTDEDTEIIWIVFGNRTRRTGRFHDCFNKFRHRWDPESIDARTCKMTNKKQIAKWEEDHGEDSDFFRVRVRGLEPKVDVDQFIPYDIVQAARGKHLRDEQFNFAPKIIGVDPKYSGSDEFAVYLRQGLACKKLGVFTEGTDDDAKMAARIAQFEDDEQADAVFIDAGYGTGILSAGKMLGRRNWQIVWFGGESRDPGYANLRAFMWGSMRQWLKDGAAIPDDEQLAEELTGPQSYLTSGKQAGKIILESKDDMKARKVPSPNRADAIALTFAFPVRPKRLLALRGMSPRKPISLQKEYQLFKRK